MSQFEWDEEPYPYPFRSDEDEIPDPFSLNEIRMLRATLRPGCGDFLSPQGRQTTEQRVATLIGMLPAHLKVEFEAPP